MASRPRRSSPPALRDGYQSGESWADLLRNCARRGMRAPGRRSGTAPWASGRPWPRCFPDIRARRCWVHKAANVLGAMPNSAHSGAKKAVREVYDAEDEQHAQAVTKTFARLYGAKF